jgi:hypothetical protein
VSERVLNKVQKNAWILSVSERVEPKLDLSLLHQLVPDRQYFWIGNDDRVPPKTRLELCEPNDLGLGRQRVQPMPHVLEMVKRMPE